MKPMITFTTLPLIPWPRACQRARGFALIAATLILAPPARADWALYVSSYGNNKIIKYNTNGVATVFATNGVNGVLSEPNGLAFDDLENLYVANAGNNTIEKYDPQGNGTLFAASGGSAPNGLAFDGHERLLVANSVGENIYRITNSSGQGSVFASGLAVLDEPQGMAFDNLGNLWVANPNGGWIEKFDPQGNGMKVYSTNLASISCIVFDTAGNLYVDGGNQVVKFDTQGNRTTFASGGGLSTAKGMAFDSAGNMYVASFGSSSIQKVDPQGHVTSFATAGSGLSTPTFLAIREDGRYSSDWHKVAGGGGISIGTNGQQLVNGTAGQHDAGSLTGGRYGMVGGYWGIIAAVPTPEAPNAPLLTITQTGPNSVTVSWPSPSTGFNLQQNSDLSTTNWITPPEGVTDNGSIKFITVNPPSGNLYFRLKQ